MTSTDSSRQTPTTHQAPTHQTHTTGQMPTNRQTPNTRQTRTARQAPTAQTRTAHQTPTNRRTLPTHQSALAPAPAHQLPQEAAPTSIPPNAGLSPRTAAVRVLLRCGLAAGPVFVGAGLTHAVLRPGFDMARHPISMLALGDSGWIQTATFFISGLLVLLWAAGLRRVLPSRGIAIAVGVLGVGLVAAGVFPADPAFGFPEGAPAGAPATMSTAGALHAVAFGVAMVGWVGAAVLLARHFARTGQRAWAIASGAAVVVLLAPIAVMGATPVLYVSSVLTWAWVTAVAGRLAERSCPGRRSPRSRDDLQGEAALGVGHRSCEAACRA